MKPSLSLLLASLLTCLIFSSSSPAQWMQTGGPRGVSVLAMTERGGKYFLASQGGGVFTSADHGATWTLAHAGSPDRVMACLGSVGGTLFAGLQSLEILCSSDEGRTWQDAGAQGLKLKGTSLELAACGSTLFAAAGNRIYHTDDLGSHWDSVHEGCSSLKKFDEFGSGLVAIGAKVFAGNLSRGIFCSADKGDTWMQMNAGLEDTSIVTLAASGKYLFALTLKGVYRSADTGSTWSEANTGMPLGRVTALVASADGLYAKCADSLVCFTADSAVAWSVMGTTSPQSGQLFVIGSELYCIQAGVFTRSLDKGMTWTNEDAKFIGTDIYSFGGNGSVILAATLFSPAVFRSADRGATWIPLSTERVNGMVNCLAFSGPNLLAGGTSLDGGIDLSNDMGATWRRVSPTRDAQIEVFAVNEPYVFAAGEGVWVSADNGETWIPRNEGLGVKGKNYFGAIAVTDSGVYVAELTGDSIFVSKNNGSSWTPLPPCADMAITCLIARGPVFFAGTYGKGVYRSGDRGRMWSPYNTGLATGIITDIAESNGTLFVSTNDEGIFSSSTAGAEWKEINGGLISRHISRLFVHGADLYAGTNSMGVWRRPLSEITGVERLATEVAGVFALDQNYPNPFNPSTKLSYRIQKTGRVSLVVYDMLGREVRTLVDETESAGSYSVAFDASLLSNGTYFARLTAGGRQRLTKMLLLK